MGQDAKLFSMLSRPAGRIAGQIRDLSGKEIMALKIKITIRYKKREDCGVIPRLHSDLFLRAFAYRFTASISSSLGTGKLISSTSAESWYILEACLSLADQV